MRTQNIKAGESGQLTVSKKVIDGIVVNVLCESNPTVGAEAYSIIGFDPRKVLLTGKIVGRGAGSITIFTSTLDRLARISNQYNLGANPFIDGFSFALKTSAGADDTHRGLMPFTVSFPPIDLMDGQQEFVCEVKVLDGAFGSTWFGTANLDTATSYVRADVRESSAYEFGMPSVQFYQIDSASGLEWSKSLGDGVTEISFLVPYADPAYYTSANAYNDDIEALHVLERFTLSSSEYNHELDYLQMLAQRAFDGDSATDAYLWQDVTIYKGNPLSATQLRLDFSTSGGGCVVAVRSVRTSEQLINLSNAKAHIAKAKRSMNMGLRADPRVLADANKVVANANAQNVLSLLK